MKLEANAGAMQLYGLALQWGYLTMRHFLILPFLKLVDIES